jgi:hypothetical protein
VSCLPLVPAASPSTPPPVATNPFTFFCSQTLEPTQYPTAEVSRASCLVINFSVSVDPNFSNPSM